MLLADLHDLTAQIATDPKKRNRLKPHPLRPWKSEKVQKFGDPGDRTPDEVRAILAAAAAGQLETADPADVADELDPDAWEPYTPAPAPRPEPPLVTNPHD